jgi:hypothetical protein
VLADIGPAYIEAFVPLTIIFLPLFLFVSNAS